MVCESGDDRPISRAGQWERGGRVGEQLERHAAVGNTKAAAHRRSEHPSEWEYTGARRSERRHTTMKDAQVQG